MRRILLLAAVALAFGSSSASAQTTLSGDIYFDSTSRYDTFKVWLIVKQGNILSAVDSTVVSGFAGNVQYSFSGVTQGSYRVKAHHLNPTVLGPGLVPTYHDSALLWSAAQTITVGGTPSTGNNIYMKNGTPVTGPGFIGGNVLQGANKGTANGIEGMTMFLFDNNGNLIKYETTDANGDYAFNNLPEGTYKVHPEQLDYTTVEAGISITASDPSYTMVNFERSIQNKTITYKPTAITNVAGETVFTVYPNPAQNVVNIGWATANGEEAVISITDLSGKQVVNTTVKMNGVTTLDVSSLQTGVYMMTITEDNNSYTQKLILQ